MRTSWRDPAIRSGRIEWGHKRHSSHVWSFEVDWRTLLIWYALLRRKRHSEPFNKRVAGQQRRAERKFKKRQRAETNSG